MVKKTYLILTILLYSKFSFAHAKSMVEDLVYPIYIALLIFVAIIITLILIFRKKSPEELKVAAEKALKGRVLVSQEYCEKHELNQDELIDMIGKGDIKAISKGGVLFVKLQESK